MTHTVRLVTLTLLVCVSVTSADAQTDLLWQHSDGGLAVWTMQGTNSLSGDPLGPGPLRDPLWRISAVADFNGDTLRDLVFQHQGDGRLAVWLMNGRAQVSGLELSPSQVPDLNWKVRGAGDFNGDFKPDLIWQNEVTGQVSAWLMDGTTRPDGNGRLLSPSVVEDTDWRIVGVADFNRDGQSDLLWQHQSSGFISVWHMNGLSTVDGVLLSPGQVADTDLKIRAVGDVNGDERPDLIWQNQATGLLSAWLMNDFQRVSEVPLSPDRVFDTNWRIVGMHDPESLPRRDTSAALWAIVVDGDICIGGTIEVIAGQAVGRSGTQTQVCGVFFEGLTPGLGMTLRASAPGYVPQEMTVLPTARGGPLTPIIFDLSRIQN